MAATAGPFATAGKAKRGLGVDPPGGRQQAGQAA